MPSGAVLKLSCAFLQFNAKFNAVNLLPSRHSTARDFRISSEGVQRAIADAEQLEEEEEEEEEEEDRHGLGLGNESGDHMAIKRKTTGKKGKGKGKAAGAKRKEGDVLLPPNKRLA